MATLTHHVDADTVWLDFETASGRKFSIDVASLKLSVPDFDRPVDEWIAEATSDAALARARKH